MSAQGDSPKGCSLPVRRSVSGRLQSLNANDDCRTAFAFSSLNESNINRGLADLSLSLPETLRSFVCSRRFVALFAVLLTGVIPASASPRKPSTHRHPRLHTLAHAFVNVTMPAAGLLPDDEDEFPLDGQRYELKLVRAYTGEVLNVVYRIGDTYIPD